MLKIALYCTKGAPCFIFTPETIVGRGVGGAELGVMTIAQALAAAGNDVSLFNECPAPGVYDGVRYGRSDQLENVLETDWDAFILFRNPMPGDLLPRIPARKRVFFSCDQYTEGNYATDVFPFVERIVAISPYHRDYLVDRYHISPHRITPLDLPVRTWEYSPQVALPRKAAHRLIFCSVPDRGLEHLAHLFPRIRALVPDAELVITSDYSLWGEGIGPSNERFREMFAGMPGVLFLGKVPRSELVRIQLSADILAYPNQPVCENCELFGISVAECQVAGAIPVISAYGAFPTTVIDGFVLSGHPGEPDYRNRFVAAVLALWSDRDRLTARQTALRQAAMARFAVERSAQLWLDVLRT